MGVSAAWEVSALATTATAFGAGLLAVDLGASALTAVAEESKMIDRPSALGSMR